MKPIKKIMALVMALTISCLFCISPPAVAASSTDNALTGEYLQQLMNLAQEQYNYDITEAELTQGAIKGIFSSMDAYTEFFTMEESRQFMETVGGTYSGIGVVLSQMENFVVVTRVFSLSPAEKSGIMIGDKIATIEGKDVIGASVDEVSSLIRGEEDSSVHIGILRDKSLHNYTLTRKSIKINPINYEIRDGIAYISIDTFNSNTYDYWAEAQNAADAAGVDRIILDLRNNVGGEVDQAIAVARQLVPEGTISTLEFRNPSLKDTIYKSYLDESPYKIVVLVNGMTASASEILAGAIQDTRSGTLVGSKTFGKARVQSVLPILSPEGFKKYGQKSEIVNVYDLKLSEQMALGDEDVLGLLKITTGTYKTPAGRMIDGLGLTPDETVVDPEVKNGIYVNSIVKLTQTVKPALNDEGLDVYNAEKILKIIGYEIGTPDMMLDSQTFAAIQKFQSDQGLYAYGVLDFTTQQALNQQYYKVLPEVDQQYGRALEILKAQ